MAVDLGRAPHGRRLGAELGQGREVLADVALDGEHADAGQRAVDASACAHRPALERGPPGRSRRVGLRYRLGSETSREAALTSARRHRIRCGHDDGARPTTT